jgi:hypothetical protein
MLNILLRAASTSGMHFNGDLNDGFQTLCDVLSQRVKPGPHLVEPYAAFVSTISSFYPPRIGNVNRWVLGTFSIQCHMKSLRANFFACVRAICVCVRENCACT